MIPPSQTKERACQLVFEAVEILDLNCTGSVVSGEVYDRRRELMVLGLIRLSDLELQLLGGLEFAFYAVTGSSGRM